jgi:hypothetical protein
VNTDPRRWKCRKTFFGNFLSAPLADSVGAVTKPFGCSVQFVEFAAGLVEQALHLRSFERDRYPFWVVLVVIDCPGGGLGKSIILTRQRLKSPSRAEVFLRQPLLYGPLLGWGQCGAPVSHDNVNDVPAVHIPRQPSRRVCRNRPEH